MNYIYLTSRAGGAWAWAEAGARAGEGMGAAAGARPAGVVKALAGRLARSAAIVASHPWPRYGEWATAGARGLGRSRVGFGAQ